MRPLALGGRQGLLSLGTFCYCQPGIPNDSSPCSPAVTQDVRDPRTRSAFRRKRQLNMVRMLRVEMRAQVRPEMLTLPQVSAGRKGGPGEWPIPSPTVFPFAIIPEDGLSRQEEKWLVVGVWENSWHYQRAHVMVVTKLCNVQCTTPLDNDHKPGKMESGHWIKDERELLRALERHSYSWNDRGKDQRHDLMKKKKNHQS